MIQITQFEIYAASLFLFFGLIHGCYDWMVLYQEWGESKLYGLVEVTSFYYVLVWPYLLVWIFWPEMGVISFLILTILHWGQEDLYIHSKVLKYGAKSKTVFILGRGSVAVILPLVNYREEYRIVMNSVLSLFSREGSLWWFYEDHTVIILVLATFTLLAVHHMRNTSMGSLATTALLVSWFTLAPVFISIPVYLAVYHSGQRLLRLFNMGVESLREFVFYPLPYLVGSAVVFIFSMILIPRMHTKPLSITSSYLVFLSLLTLPHTLITYVLDKGQGVY